MARMDDKHKLNTYLNKKFNLINICAICRESVYQNPTYKHQCNHIEHLQCIADKIFCNRGNPMQRQCSMCRAKYNMVQIKEQFQQNEIKPDGEHNFICYTWCANKQTRLSKILCECDRCERPYHLVCLISNSPQRVNEQLGRCLNCLIEAIHH